MKIEKRKVCGNRPLSTAAKSAIATTLGMAAVFALNACDDGSSARSDDNQEPLGGIVVPEEPLYPDSILSSETESSSSQKETTPSSSTLTEEPANSSQVENTQSSSSQVVDIPLSQEPVSSSLMDAISSALESSSSVAEPASSETDPTSSTITPESSSETVEPASSSSQPTEEEIRRACQGWQAADSVNIGGQLYLCPDNGGGMLFSMISTFERTDVET